MKSRPPKPTLSLNVGIVGHRYNKLPDDVSVIEGHLAEVLRSIDAACADFQKRHGGLYAAQPHQVRLMTGYAEGADQFAITARPKDWKVAAILPFPRERYREDFAPENSSNGQDNRGRFDELLALAETVTELPGGRAIPQRSAEEGPDIAAAYADVGAFLLRQIDILVAVWDGTLSAGAGGTAEIVGKAVGASIPVVWISTAEAPPLLLLRRQAAPQSRIAATPASIAEVVGRTLALLERPPGIDAEMQEHVVTAAERLARFQTERWRPVCHWVAYDWLKRGGHVWTWRLRLDALPAGEGHTDWTHFLEEAPRGGGSLERIRDVLHPRFNMANNLATHFSHVYRSAYILIYFLALVAVAIALYSLLPFDDHGDKIYALHHKAGLVLGELVTVFIIIGVVWLGRRQSWHDRWVDYRALAEMLRHLRFLCLLGEYGVARRAYMQLTSPGTEWVVWYVRATARELGVPGAVLDADYQRKSLQATWKTEVVEQIDYNTRNARELSHLHHRLHRWGDFCFFGTAGVLLLFLVALAVDGLLPDCPGCQAFAGSLGVPAGMRSLTDLLYALKPYVSFAAAFLPALGAALASINFTGDFEGFSRRSAQTAQGLAQLEAEYQRALEELDLDATSEVLLATARIMTEDISFWQSLYSHKRLTLPS